MEDNPKKFPSLLELEESDEEQEHVNAPKQIEQKNVEDCKK